MDPENTTTTELGVIRKAVSENAISITRLIQGFEIQKGLIAEITKDLKDLIKQQAVLQERSTQKRGLDIGHTIAFFGLLVSALSIAGALGYQHVQGNIKPLKSAIEHQHQRINMHENKPGHLESLARIHALETEVRGIKENLRGK